MVFEVYKVLLISKTSSQRRQGVGWGDKKTPGKDTNRRFIRGERIANKRMKSSTSFSGKPWNTAHHFASITWAKKRSNNTKCWQEHWERTRHSTNESMNYNYCAQRFASFCKVTFLPFTVPARCQTTPCMCALGEMDKIIQNRGTVAKRVGNQIHGQDMNQLVF